MEIDTDLESRLEKYFEEWFQHSLRDLRGTEVEIMTMKASAHHWFFAGVTEMRKVFMAVVIDNNDRFLNELDPLKLPR